MNFLLDTNVVSELLKPAPNPGVVSWLDQADEDRLFLSVVTFAEIRRGIERLPPGTRRNRLDHWLAVDLALRFEGRLLTVDREIAEAWGRLVALGEAIGRRMNVMDAFLAATAERRELRLVTRNVIDFAPIGLAVTNPWTS